MAIELKKANFQRPFACIYINGKIGVVFLHFLLPGGSPDSDSPVSESPAIAVLLDLF
jgi:hypothetical protein